MLRILLLFYIIIAVTNGHRDISKLKEQTYRLKRESESRECDTNNELNKDKILKLTNDADLQSELLPQELNPFFVPAEESQMQAMPLPLRLRRESEVVTIPENTTIQQVKTYTRIVTGVVLVLSAIVEIVSYILETYAT